MVIQEIIIIQTTTNLVCIFNLLDDNNLNFDLCTQQNNNKGAGMNLNSGNVASKI